MDVVRSTVQTRVFRFTIDEGCLTEVWDIPETLASNLISIQQETDAVEDPV